MSKLNFLTETIGTLTSQNLGPNDVRWVGTRNGLFVVTWEEFAKFADVEYDDGFGGEEIPLELVVVGDDWWLERHEYDGSEWWEFKTKPTVSSDPKPFTLLRESDRKNSKFEVISCE